MDEILIDKKNINLDFKNIVENLTCKVGLKKNKYGENMGVATHVNAPNNNLELISKQSDSWVPLFKRTTSNNKKPTKSQRNSLKEKYLNRVKNNA